MKVKGYLLAALAAAAYGTNPMFAVPLYEQGMNPNSVLLFRYMLGLPLLLAMMLWRGHSLRPGRGDVWPVVMLGVLMAFSSLGLFESYKYMNSGVASTLLFVYPIMVAVLMILFFRERFKATVGLCLLIMSAGLFMLMKTGDGEPLSPYGCLLVMVSALTYALYIVIVNVSARIRAIPTSKLLFYVLLSGSVVFLAMVPAGSEVVMPRGAGWWNVAGLAVVPTVLSLACTTRAIQLIGSTPTAILGALEPVTAVVLSVVALDQAITGRELLGGALIVVATTLVVMDERVERALMHVRKLFPRRGGREKR